jgi:hypothetical protein
MPEDHPAGGNADTRNEASTARSDDDGVTPDALTSFLRTLLGGAVEGKDVILERLVPPGSPSTREGDDGTADRARHALVGLVFDAYGFAREGVSTASRIASVGWSVIEPVAGPLLAPVRRPTQALLDRWVRIGRHEEARGREAAREVTRVPVDDVVRYLRDNPEMEALVRRQAEALLERLRDEPRVGSMVRAQGDEYIAHLRENPEGVQELVQGQSVGMVNEVLDTVRERATDADAFLERIARAVLGRRPRSEVPGPSPEVRVLAANPRLKTDE